MTPPELLGSDQYRRPAESLSCCAEIFCKLPNSTLDDVSLPVRATPSQPMNGEKNGNNIPVEASAIPMVVSVPLLNVP